MQWRAAGCTWLKKITVFFFSLSSLLLYFLYFTFFRQLKHAWATSCWVSPAAAVSPVKRTTLAVEEGTASADATDFEMGYLHSCSRNSPSIFVSTCSCAPRIFRRASQGPQDRVVPLRGVQGKTCVKDMTVGYVVLQSAAPAGSSPWVYRGIIIAVHRALCLGVRGL